MFWDVRNNWLLATRDVLPLLTIWLDYSSIYLYYCVLETNQERMKLRCSFSETYRGYWQLFDRGRHETVYINESHALFSESGTFICKGKSMEDEHQYKAVSVFTNGW